MTRPVAFRQSDVSRLIRGAVKGGWPVGSFKVAVENGQPVILPLSGNENTVAPAPDDLDTELAAWRAAHGD